MVDFFCKIVLKNRNICNQLSLFKSWGINLVFLLVYSHKMRRKWYPPPCNENFCEQIKMSIKRIQIAFRLFRSHFPGMFVWAKITFFRDSITWKLKTTAINKLNNENEKNQKHIITIVIIMKFNNHTNVSSFVTIKLSALQIF